MSLAAEVWLPGLTSRLTLSRPADARKGRVTLEFMGLEIDHEPMADCHARVSRRSETRINAVYGRQSVVKRPVQGDWPTGKGRVYWHESKYPMILRSAACAVMQ